MGRQYFIAIICLGLAGCGNVLNMVSESDDRQALGQRDACHVAAAQRAEDAGYNGYDGTMQRKIYAHTYADCAAQEKKSKEIARLNTL